MIIATFTSGDQTIIGFRKEGRKDDIVPGRKALSPYEQRVVPIISS